MTVADLIALLEEQDPDAEVLIAHQPSWPLAVKIANVADVEGIVWIADGDHPTGRSPYAPRAAWGDDY